jgi:hypothetical protein
MSSVDIFYLALVACAFTGFGIALAYFSQQDLRFRTARQRAEEDAAKQVTPKAPVVERTLEHA